MFAIDVNTNLSDAKEFLQEWSWLVGPILVSLWGIVAYVRWSLKYYPRTPKVKPSPESLMSPPALALLQSMRRPGWELNREHNAVTNKETGIIVGPNTGEIWVVYDRDSRSLSNRFDHHDKNLLAAEGKRLLETLLARKLTFGQEDESPESTGETAPAAPTAPADQTDGVLCPSPLLWTRLLANATTKDLRALATRLGFSGQWVENKIR